MSESGVHLRSALLQEHPTAPETSHPPSHRRFALYRNEVFLLDPKTYGHNPDDPHGELVEERVIDLARFLSSLPSNDYLTLQCKGVFETHNQFCFLYHLPPGCSNPPSHKVPKSLLEFVDSTFKPSLTDRIKLAHRLTLAIARIHRAGWIHKGITSGNILFFPSRWKEPRNLNNPRLVGFDFARKEGPEEYSEKLLPTDSNLYRHPDVLRDPTTSFKRIHDYYALGVVLAEIAVWRSIKKVLKSHTSLQGAESHETDVRKIRDILLDRESAENHPRDIAFRMGDIYWKVVYLCLSGDFGVPKHADEQVTAAFERDVVLPLSSCII